MVKSSTASRHRASGTKFGRRVNNALRLLSMVFVACVTISCVTASPPGEVSQVSVSEVQQGAINNGVSVRWGGTIAKVYNKPDMTVLEVVSRPLLRSGRPKHNDSTDGRFLAEIKGFLDPEIIKPGRDISVIGLVGRLTTGQIGEADYSYPVMTVSNYQYWKEIIEVAPYRGYPYYFSDDRFWPGWPDRYR